MGSKSSNCATGFLSGFAPRHLLGGFSRIVHNAGDDLQQPGTAGKFQGSDPELLQQNYLVLIGVIQQNSDRMTALQTFAGDVGTPAAPEQFVPQPVFFHAEETVIADGFFEDSKLIVHAKNALVARIRPDGPPL